MRLFFHSRQGLLALVVMAFFISNCGEISLGSADDLNSDTAEVVEFSEAATLDSYAFALATDFASSSQLYFLSLAGSTTTITNSGVQELGSSGVIHLFDDLLYVLHDGYSLISSDNLQIIDPLDSYKTYGQWSTGNGTNPHDVAVTGLRAFVSLYNPSADIENFDSEGLPGDVIEMNLSDGSITHRYAFTNYLNADDAQAALAGDLLLQGNQLYVLIQDLDPNTFAADAAGKLGIINVQTHTIEDVLTLQGRNPTSLALSADGKRLFISHMATYDYTSQSFDTTTEFGGIEIVNLTTLTTEAFLNDEDLGGYVEQLMVSDDFVYAVVSNVTEGNFTSILTQLPQNATDANEAVTFDDSGTDIRATIFQNGFLWISRQGAGGANPEIEIYNEVTGEKVGDSLLPVATAMSFTSL